MADELQTLLAEIRACRVCADVLPLGPRPVVRAARPARVLIIGQAPGTRVHETGVPWNDPSGDRLRAWLDVDRDTFYDETQIAIAPMGFCYPGRDGRGGDRPPRPECAPLWHERLLAQLDRLALVLLVGRYAQNRYLGKRRAKTLSETVKAGPLRLQSDGPLYWPLPHPSWRNTALLKKNPWFEAQTLPALQVAFRRALGTASLEKPG